MKSFAPIIVGLLLVAVAGSGCVTRRMTVRSNVPGAQVYVDNYEIGRTPASTDFTYYGRRNIRLVKDGFETLTVEQPVQPPWYQWPGLDFVFENVWPLEIRDERQFAFELKPQYVVPTESLLGRAEELRGATGAAAAAPTATGGAPVVGPSIGPQPIGPQPPGPNVSPFNTPSPVASPYGANPYGQPAVPAPATGLPGYPSPPAASAFPGTMQPAPGAAGPYAQPTPYGAPAAPLPGYGGTPVPQLP